MIEQIKEELEKATPGPWKYQTGFYGSNHLVYEIETDNLVCTAKTHFKTVENMKLIANTPTYIRYLLDELDTVKEYWMQERELANGQKEFLRNELEKAQKEVEWWKSEFREQEETIATVASESHILITEHTAMKEALEWYEDGENYSRTEDDYRIGYPPEIMFDKGIKAREVLATLTKEDI